ncbi:MAG: DUF58 domain-containing protein [Caldilineaceae bacterium]
MRRPFVLSLVVYGLVTVALASRQGTILLLALPPLLTLIAGLLTRPDAAALTVQRTLSATRVLQGETVDVAVTVHNDGPRLDLVTISAPPPPSQRRADLTPVQVTQLERGASTELAYELRPPRGAYTFPPVTVTVADRFGLFPRRTVHARQTSLLVLPAVERAAEARIRPPRTRIFSGPIAARKGGPGVEFFGVRAFQPGDSLHWVNQRASARYPDQPYVNEFEQERAVDVGLILDVRRSANVRSDGASLLDASVGAAAALADAFLGAGNRVGLFLYGGGIDWTLPGYGKVQRERIMQALARAQPEEHQVFRSLGFLPTRLFPVRSQLVLVSPLLDSDLEDLVSLRARGYEVLLVSPDAVAFEAGALPDDRARALAVRMARLEREQVLRQLRAGGVSVFEWAADTPFHVAAVGQLDRMPHWRRGPGGV